MEGGFERGGGMTDGTAAPGGQMGCQRRILNLKKMSVLNKF